MSEEGIEAFKRAEAAFARRDIDALLAECDPEIEWFPGTAALLAGETTVYRGHAGIRQLVHDMDDAFSVVELEFDEYRDLGDRVLGIGKIRTRGRASDIETVSPVAYLVDRKDGKAVRVRTYMDVEEAIEAASSSA
jgi:ketosteroid isomerase-like protein